LTSIFVKIESNLKKKITKMLSEKFSTNPESFKGFGRGRRIGWRLHMDTPIYRFF
jgi:predicted DNA-binding ArsR family transcriptional regulator